MTDFEYDMQNFEKKIRIFFENIRKMIRTEIDDSSNPTHLHNYTNTQESIDIDHMSKYCTYCDNFARYCGHVDMLTVNEEKKKYKSNISSTMYQYHFRDNEQHDPDQIRNSDTHPQNTLRRRIKTKIQEQHQHQASVYKHNDIFNVVSYPPMDFRLKRSYVEETPYRRSTDNQTNNKSNVCPRSEGRDVVIQIFEEEALNHNNKTSDVKSNNNKKSHKSKHEADQSDKDQCDDYQCDENIDLEMGYGRAKIINPPHKLTKKNDIHALVQDAYIVESKDPLVEQSKPELVIIATKNPLPDISIDVKITDVVVPASQNIMIVPVQGTEQNTTQNEQITETIKTQLIEPCVDVYQTNNQDKTTNIISSESHMVDETVEIVKINKSDDEIDNVQVHNEKVTECSIHVSSDNMDDVLMQNYTNLDQDLTKDFESDTEITAKDQSNKKIEHDQENQTKDSSDLQNNNIADTDIIITEEDLSFSSEEDNDIQLISRISDKKRINENIIKTEQNSSTVNLELLGKCVSTPKNQIESMPAVNTTLDISLLITEDDIVCLEPVTLENSSIGFSDSNQLIPNL